MGNITRFSIILLTIPTVSFFHPSQLYDTVESTVLIDSSAIYSQYAGFSSRRGR